MASREVTENGAHEVSLTETVSTIFQKRIRALKKKVRNVEEIEKKVKEGKSINDQQSSALQLKPVTLSLIEEVERLGKAVDEVRGKASDDGEKELEKAVKEAERWRRRCEKLEKEKKEHQQRARKER